MLQLFPTTQFEMLDDAGRRPVPGVEPTFSDAFSTAWRENLDHAQSIAQARLTDAVVEEKIDAFYRLSGQRIAFPRSPAGGDDPKYLAPWGNAQRQVDRWNASNPENRFEWPAEDILNGEVLKRSRAAVGAREAMEARPQSWASWFGQKAADMGGAATEPWNVALTAFGAPWAAGALRFALTEGVLGMAGQTAAEAQAFGFKREVDPEWSVGQAAVNVAGAGVSGFGIGLGLKGIAATWRRVRTGGWSRDTIDAGNVVDREAQIAETNPFSGAEGEITHRAAFQKAGDDILNGRPVDLSETIPPQQFPAAPFADIPPSLPTAERFIRPATDVPIAEVRAAPDTAETLAQQAARVIAARPDFEVTVPMRDAAGNVSSIRRRADDLLGEVDNDLAAARELRACATGLE